MIGKAGETKGAQAFRGVSVVVVIAVRGRKNVIDKRLKSKVAWCILGSSRNIPQNRPLERASIEG